MVYKGFTWNCPPLRAELLLTLLLDIEETGRYKIDRYVVGLLIEDLIEFLEVAPDGTTSSTSGPNATKAARLDGYRDRRRRLC